MYLSFFMLYKKLDEAFLIENRIAEEFPGQMDELGFTEFDTEDINDTNKELENERNS